MISEAHTEGRWLSERARSFHFALCGLRRLFRESNVKIHAAATLAVVVAGAAAHLAAVEWALVALAAGFVWVAEAVNTAIELLSDAAVPTRHPLIGEAKDVAACAVLVSAIAAVVVGAVVFLPHLTHG
jgi:diacylglycerol kinase (ATP)